MSDDYKYDVPNEGFRDIMPWDAVKRVIDHLNQHGYKADPVTPEGPDGYTVESQYGKVLIRLSVERFDYGWILKSTGDRDINTGARLLLIGGVSEFIVDGKTGVVYELTGSSVPSAVRARREDALAEFSKKYA